MRYLALAIILLGLTALVCSSESSSYEKGKLLIAVAGDGVPSEFEPPSRLYPLNRAQGRTMWDGAKAALDSSARLEGLSERIELIGYDDGSSDETAQEIARKIAREPRILGVIGHATSGTTRNAAWLYAKAGIPLLMPIATSPFVMYPPKKQATTNNRLNNAFRLVPSDHRAQAPAVALVASERLGPDKRIFLIRDISKGAADYSAPLFAALDRMLLDNIVDRMEVDREKSNFVDAVNKIRAQKVDLVIFAGYGTTAQTLFHSLRGGYADVDTTDRPMVLLTDGCRIRDLDAGGFETYLTFPLPGVDYYIDRIMREGNPIPEDLRIIKNVIRDKENDSYQMYGYDAMLIIGEAIKKCDARMSRSCILETIREHGTLKGAVLPYSFLEGENTHSPYYVFYSPPTKSDRYSKFEMRWEISQESLNRYLSENPLRR